MSIQEAKVIESRSWVHYYFRSTSGVIGAVLVFLVLIASLVALFKFYPHDPLGQNQLDSLQGPSRRHWFGTDQFGRDTFSRVLDGMRRSISISIVSVSIATTIGVSFGILSGYFGGWFDAVVMRVSDVFFAFPAILLALAIVSGLGNTWINTSIAIAIVYTPIFVRVARGPVLSAKEMDYVKSARVLGFSTPRIVLKHVLPNVFAPILVQIALSLSWAILTESGLSFLGLGTQAPNASLGLMVAEAQSLVAFAWWTLAAPSVFITLAVVGLNLVGDGLRSALDPTWRSS